jgi:hypothetical protein
MIFVCGGVMYSGEYDVCDVTLSVLTRELAPTDNMRTHTISTHL